jgi:hypothetical protein
LSFRLDQLLDKHWRDELVHDGADSGDPADADVDVPAAVAGGGRRGGVAQVTPPALVGAAFVDAETRRLFSLDNVGAFECDAARVMTFCVIR